MKIPTEKHARILARRMVMCVCLAVSLCFPMEGAKSQEALQFEGDIADLKPFFGRWEGKWDGRWPMWIIVRPAGEGRLELSYAFKSQPDDEDYEESTFEWAKLHEDWKLQLGKKFLMERPKEGDDGKTMFATIVAPEGNLRSVMKRISD